MSEYPEHDKLEGLGLANETVGNFLEWLGMQNYQIMEYLPYWDNGKSRYIHSDSGEGCKQGGIFCLKDVCKINPEYDEREAGYYLVHKGGIEGWIAEYFDLDANRLEAEKRAMLEQIRNGGSRDERATGEV